MSSDEKTEEKKKSKAEVRSYFSFGEYEFKLMEIVRGNIHNDMYMVRRGMQKFLRPAHSSLEEYYIWFLRPLLLEEQIANFDSRFNEVYKLIVARQDDIAAEKLKELSKDVALWRQLKNIGIMVEREDRRKGITRFFKDDEKVSPE